ncbi:MAG: hypothetical protein BWY54_01043 [Candidatus Dependentiae bacterium ADurb.Bin331]|nr:MAG: hypothetical protein BWY54_01043 [Candidatus Dependentiae bacterium ADurb.Bin331]
MQRWKRAYITLNDARRKKIYSIEELEKKGLREIAKDIDGCYAHVVIQYPASAKMMIDFELIENYLKENADSQFEIKRELLNDAAAAMVKKTMNKMTPKQAVLAWADDYFDEHADSKELKDSVIELANSIIDKVAV